MMVGKQRAFTATGAVVAEVMAVQNAPVLAVLCVRVSVPDDCCASVWPETTTCLQGGRVGKPVSCSGSSLVSRVQPRCANWGGAAVSEVSLVTCV